MDPKHTGEILKHLEKQNELLSESRSLIFHELHKLQVEEEMLMRKFHELMQARPLNEKNKNSDPVCSEDDQKGNTSDLVCEKSNAQ
ncbi:putative Glucan endo-1,3-beta-glucosidase [Hibiscus syriacus]|uniref:Glucan endo-1,3-beta-glucosidase n=1 Tax=Hibiscus syriacus TaxID=106335 RepID=A0A6A2WTT0_HIBSY|nr:putative Glucan endo-1,3-beta-glucosidase [Hibiscus syriacus]